MDPRDIITKDITISLLKAKKKSKLKSLGQLIERKVKIAPRRASKAMKSRRKYRFGYTRKADEKRVVRTVEPYSFRDDALMGYDVKRKGIRRYIVSRIDKPKILRGKFKPKWKLEP